MILQWRKLQLAQEHNNIFTSWDETQISPPHAHLHKPGSAPRPYQPRARLRAVILTSPLPLPALAATCRVTNCRPLWLRCSTSLPGSPSSQQGKASRGVKGEQPWSRETGLQHEKTGCPTSPGGKQEAWGTTATTLPTGSTTVLGLDTASGPCGLNGNPEAEFCRQHGHDTGREAAFRTGFLPTALSFTECLLRGRHCGLVVRGCSVASSSHSSAGQAAFSPNDT